MTANSAAGTELLKLPIDMPVAVPRQICVVQIVMTPQTQHLDTVVDVLVAMQQRVPLTPMVQKTCETQQLQFIDGTVDETSGNAEASFHNSEGSES